MTLTETMIATAIMMTVTGGVFTILNPVQGAFQAQPEVSDMLQRLRVGVDALVKDLLMAGAGATSAPPAGAMYYEFAPVLPMGAGAIGIRYAASPGAGIVTRTYYLKTDTTANTFQLMRRDASQVDLPVVDHVVKLEFEYFGDSPAALHADVLAVGPRCPDALDSGGYDADILLIRRVHVVVRVQVASASLRGPAGPLFMRGGTSTSAERYVPDQEIQFDVTPRNLNSGVSACSSSP